MIELTDQQLREIRASGWPPEVRDPRTGETFVLIHREMFERVRAILDEEDGIADIEEMLPLVSEVLEADEDSDEESA